MNTENLIIIPDENLTRTSFPITFEKIMVPRTKENEAKYRHLTVLILGVYIYEDDKIMVINKYPKNSFEYPEIDFPKICLDIPGGHCVYDALSEIELKNKEISEETIRKQAFREWSEEVCFNEKESNPFCEHDLKFAGFYPCDSANNRELAALFIIAIPFASGNLKTQDNVKETIIPLPNKAVSYEKLLNKWQRRHEMTAHMRFEDGLGRLMMREDIPKKIEKIKKSFESKGYYNEYL